MSLVNRIDEDLKTAMKAQEVSLLSTLRMLKSALKNAEIALGHELSDPEAISVLDKQAKQRSDSIEQYKAGGREDLAATEAAELEIIVKYLPQKLDEASVESLIDEAIGESGAAAISDMGKVIKLVMEKAAGAADGKMVAEIVKRKLS